MKKKHYLCGIYYQNNRDKLSNDKNEYHGQ